MSKLDLDIDLDGVARRLSFSPGSPQQLPPRPHTRFQRQPALSPIAEDPREQQQQALGWASSPFPAPHTATYERPVVSFPPVSPSPVRGPIVPVSPAPSGSPSETQQQQQAAAALGWASSPFPAPHTATYLRPVMSFPPVSPTPVRGPIVPVSPAPSGSPSETQQQQQVAAALVMLEQKRQAGLQQAWVEAQQKQALASAFGGYRWDQRRQAGLQPSWALSELEQGRLPGSHLAWAEAQPHPGPPPPQQLRLYTVEGEPAGYKTKWEELHPVSQQLLLQIEDKIRKERQECEQLDQCSRLYDPSVSNNGFELDARQIAQEIGSISIIMDREKASIKSLMDAVREIMSNVEFAIGSYVNLRPWFINRGAGMANHGHVRRPSIFLQHIVDRFEKQVEECCKLIEELEQLVQMKNNKTYPASLECLPKVMSNMHDYFMYVASKVENLHQCAETIRIQHLNDLQSSGNRNDPFAEADRKEAAKQEAAARTVHPTLTNGDTLKQARDV